jgi:ABC-type transport system substrate-binding protein
MVGYFAEVGVEVNLDVVSDQVLTERRDTNDIDMFTFHGGEGGAGMEAILDPRWHIPGEFWGKFGLGWYLDLADTPDNPNPNAVPLPEELAADRAAYLNATAQPTLEGQIEAMKGVLETSADRFWVIGISRPGPGYQPMSSRLHNFPEDAYTGWLPGTHKITRPEQWFIKE